ncbi:MAG: hypothetical protein ACYSO7_01255 [Planctomycetota bacterium]
MKVLRIFSLLLSCLCVVSIVGCVINLGSYNAKFDRVVELSEVLGADSKLSAQTSNGSINVTGTEMELCTITATINARSFTVEEAQLLAEQTDVRLEQTPEKRLSNCVRVMVKSESPQLKKPSTPKPPTAK